LLKLLIRQNFFCIAQQ